MLKVIGFRCSGPALRIRPRLVALLLLVVCATSVRAAGTIVGWGSVDSPANIPNIIAGAAGYGFGLALKEDGTIVPWGGNNRGELNVPFPNADFAAIAAGLYHGLGLKRDGSIVAWGANESGQCEVPEPNEGFIAISAGEFHSLGLKADGSIVAWGGNDDGQCNVPLNNTEFRAVSAGRFHSIALKSDGSLVAWGRNDFGQSSLPAPNSGFVGVAAGYSYNLALRVNGSILAWGKNDYGQINVPSPNAGFVTMAGGYAHSLAVRADGMIVAWGANNFQQRNVPPPNADFTAVAAGFNHSVGVKGNIFALAIYDVPNDQGGEILASWRKHGSDPTFVDRYDFQRFLGNWKTLKSLAATEADTYSVVVPTSDILTVGQPAPVTFYRLVAHTMLPGLEYATPPVAGYSVDNLPPPMPQAGLADGPDYRVIYWDSPGIPDLEAACVYRGTTSGFEITEPIACPSDYFLESHLAWYFYRVRFRDSHGNWSEPSVELHGQFPTDVGEPAPAQFALFQNAPNPFNPKTELRYTLSTAGRARLTIHDLAGRRVRTLVDAEQAAGPQEIAWDGRDVRGQAVGSGVYVARLESEGTTRTIRMALLR